MSQQLRSRRSNLAVPGSSPKMLDKARGLAADQVFMDIEDAVAPIAKPEARKNIVAALNEGGYEGKVRSVRVNDWTTQWTYADVIEVVEGAGAKVVMAPSTLVRKRPARGRSSTDHRAVVTVSSSPPSRGPTVPSRRPTVPCRRRDRDRRFRSHRSGG